MRNDLRREPNGDARAQELSQLCERAPCDMTTQVQWKDADGSWKYYPPHKRERLRCMINPQDAVRRMLESRLLLQTLILQWRAAAGYDVCYIRMLRDIVTTAVPAVNL